MRARVDSYFAIANRKSFRSVLVKAGVVKPEAEKLDIDTYVNTDVAKVV